LPAYRKEAILMHFTSWIRQHHGLKKQPVLKERIQVELSSVATFQFLFEFELIAYACIHIYMCVCVYTYMCVYTYACICH
jgi:hypothetical protein